MKKYTIEINNVIKKYDDFTAVKDVSFDVNEGEMFGMLGPNGAGKSTLIESIVGLRKIDSGVIKVLGKDISNDIKSLKSSVSIQLQTSHLFPYLKVKELLNLFSTINYSKRNYKDLLERCSAAHFLNKKMKELSGGQSQLVSVVCAILANAEIYFFDEPTSAMDPQTRRYVWELLEELKAMGKTIFFTTHDMDEAYLLCDRVGIMNKGEIIALDKPDFLISKYSSCKVLSIMKEEIWNQSALESLLTINKYKVEDDKILIYTNNIVDTVIELKDKCTTYGIDFKDFSLKETSLEDVFLILTGRRYEDENINSINKM